MSDHLSLADFERFDPKAPAGNRRERRFCCPLPGCGDSKPIDQEHRSLALNTSTGLWKCHRCGAEGKITDRWEDRAPMTKATRSRAAATRAFALAPRAATPEPTPEATAKESRWRAAWDASFPIAGTPGAAYVESRSIPTETATAAGARFSPDWAEGAKPGPAVLCPVIDRSGLPVAIAARYIDGREDSKRTAGPKAGGVFVAWPGALDARCLAICEGQFDALALAAVGIPAIALIGTTWPDWLPRALAFRSVLIATDNDTAGDRCAELLAPALATRGVHALRFKPRQVKDWAECLGSDTLALLRTRLRGFLHTPAAILIEAADRYEAEDLDPLTDDDVRIAAARELAEAGRIDAARFLTRLLDDRAVEGTVNRHLERIDQERKSGMFGT